MSPESLPRRWTIHVCPLCGSVYGDQEVNKISGRVTCMEHAWPHELPNQRRPHCAPVEVEAVDPIVLAEEHNETLCLALLVGQGTDTWDPLCVRPRGHVGLCSKSLVASDA